MEDQPPNLPPMVGESMESEEMINFSELDELGLGEMEYYEEPFGANLDSEDIPYQLLDCEIAVQANPQAYQHVGLDSEMMPIQNENQQIIDNRMPDNMIPMETHQSGQQIYQSTQFQTNQHNIYQTPVVGTSKMEQQMVPEQAVQPMYEYQTQPLQQEDICIQNVQKVDNVAAGNMMHVPISHKTIPVSNSNEIITIQDNAAFDHVHEVQQTTQQVSQQIVQQQIPQQIQHQIPSVSQQQQQQQQQQSTPQQEQQQEQKLTPQPVVQQQQTLVQPQVQTHSQQQSSNIQIVVSTSSNAQPTVQHPIVANTVKYLPFQSTSNGQNSIIVQKSAMVSGTGQTLLFQDNSTQPRFFVQTPQGPLILSGAPATTPVQAQTQTVLVSTSQPETSKIIPPVITPINTGIVQNIAKTPAQETVPAPKSTPNIVNKPSPIFLIAQSPVKPSGVPNVMTYSQQPRLPTIPVRPKLQKIAPSPTKEQVLNKGSIQIGLANSNKNLQFMVLDPNSDSAQTTSTTSSPKLLTSNIQGISKVLPIKATKQSVNLVQLVAPNSTKKMLVNLSPSANKFGTVIQPVSKPGLPPATTATRVLMSYPRIRAPISTNSVSPATATARIIGTSAAREQNLRTISGTEANISSSKMFSQTVVRSAPTLGNPSFRVFNNTSDDSRRKACNCNRSQCLKMYCECFANGEFCQDCNCKNCCNNLENEEMRQKAIRFCLQRNPDAFHPKIGQKSNDVTHKKGCNCKRSGCLKNYCECYEAKILCTDKCKCNGCKNFEVERRPPAASHVGMTVAQHMAQKHKAEKDKREAIQVWEPNPDMKLPVNVPQDSNPFNLLTDEILDSIACCLVAQREEAENEGQDREAVERLVLQIFNDCMTNMLNLSDNKKMNKSEGEVKFLQAKK